MSMGKYGSSKLKTYIASLESDNPIRRRGDEAGAKLVDFLPGVYINDH